MPSLTTPTALQIAIQRLIKDSSIPMKILRADYRRMMEILNKSERATVKTSGDYLKQVTERHEILQYGNREALVYAAAVMPGKVAIGQRVLMELRSAQPEFLPRNALDFGTGTGANIWSIASEYAGTNLQRLVGIDSSEAMLNCARSLLNYQSLTGDERNAEAESTIAQKTQPLVDDQKVDLQRFLPTASADHGPQEGKQYRFDLVMCSNVLMELPSDPIKAMILRSLWKLTEKYLILVEPGTLEGYRNIINARHLLLGDNPLTSDIVAPCTHKYRCPLLSVGDVESYKINRWCWFEQRLDRPKYLMQLKQASGGYENHAFSYVIIKRVSAPQDIAKKPIARIIQAPTKRKQHVNMELCTSDGKLLRRQIIKTADPQGFSLARKSTHGDIVEGSSMKFD